VPRNGTECPDRPAVGTVGAGFIEPFAIITHEIVDPALSGTPGMFDERRVGESEPLLLWRKRPKAGYFGHEQQRACIVVEAVSVSAIGHCKLGMLDQSDVIGQCSKV